MHARALLFLAAPLAAAGPLAAQQTWVALDTSKPSGTPAELRYVAAISSEQSTTLELEIFGYWSEPVIGPDNVAYRRLSFPGLGEVGQLGAPELPGLRTRLAVGTDASTAVLGNVAVNTVDQVSTTLVLYPEPIAELDGGDPGSGDPDGEPEMFQKDAALYATDADFPGVAATAVAPVEPFLAAIPTAEVELFPVQYNPVQKNLVVNRLTTYTYRHLGTPTVQPPLTLDKLAVAEAACPNWPGAAPWIQGNTFEYDGRYLIVTPEAYLDALEPFIEHRKATGYAVTVITLESLPAAICGEIRAAIQAWYLTGADNFDHYCLLVGDVSELPQCTSPTIDQIPTDDLYGSPSGLGDLDEEVFVGRLSVNGASDLIDQTAKIIAYETDTAIINNYSDVLLVADEEDAPGKYVGAHEEVANFPYAVPPLFTKLYGNDPAVFDAAVSAEINQGQGLVAYRGHGTSNTWSTWNLYGESYSNGEVDALTNAQLPVVWSFSCTNSNIGPGDGIGEVWMGTDRGAVAHYGSTINSGTTKNHTLDKKMFEAVFEHGITTQGQAIAWAEDQMKLLHPNNTWANEWMYMLLGCPAMKVRRGTPESYDIVLPTEIDACSGPNCFFTAQVLDQNGNPAVGLLVTAYKPSFVPGGPDDVFFTGYTGAGGTIPIPGPTDLGTINVSARDDDGNIAKEITTVKAGSFVDIGDALVGTDGKPPILKSNAELIGGAAVKVEMLNALPNTAGLLAVGLFDSALPLYGGIVHPIPSALDVPVLTDQFGRWNYEIPSWPMGVAPGVKIFWQVGLVDPGAVEGISLSNALRATQP